MARTIGGPGGGRLGLPGLIADTGMPALPSQSRSAPPEAPWISVVARCGEPGRTRTARPSAARCAALARRLDPLQSDSAMLTRYSMSCLG
jgi:hypothetical protein